MEVRVAYGVEEEGVLDCVKRLRNVYGDHGRAKRRFWRVESRSHPGDGREEGGGSGMARAETMLGRRRRERGGEEGENTAFKDLRSGTKEGYGAVRGGDGGRLPRFGDWKNESLFPDRGNFRVPDREVEKGGKVGDGATSQMF